MIDLNIYTESKYTALSTVYGEVVADQQLTPSASASCARRRHGSSLWPSFPCKMRCHESQLLTRLFLRTGVNAQLSFVT